MKKFIYAAFVATLAFSLTGCNFILSLSKYRSTTETFTNSLISRDFDKCISLMPIENAPNFNRANFKVQLDTFRNTIVNNFGTKLDYSFIKAEKKISSEKSDELPPNTTLVLIEIHNDKVVGVLQVLFDDKTGKIDNIQALNVKQPIPDMFKFWLFGLFAVIVLGFNIYTIILVKRSNFKRKWLSYIGIILLNVPTIEYNAASGAFFKLLYFQFLLGIGFQKSGYLNSTWQIGIPLGAIFICWRLSRPRPENIMDELAENYPAPLAKITSLPPSEPGDDNEQKAEQTP